MSYFVSMMPSFNILPVSPSSPYDGDAVEIGLSLLRARGLKIMGSSPLRLTTPNYLNGNDDDRLRELHEAFANPGCDFIWHTRGGYGLTRILSALNLPEGRRPKVIGFSDASALLLHLWRHHKAKGIHGPTLARLSKESPESIEALWLILKGRAREINWPRLNKLWWPDSLSVVEGELIAANLCVLSHLVGTGSMPNLSGSILVLEEVSERPYRIDRMLTHLLASGTLTGVKAIVLGQLTDCQEPGQKELTAESVVAERCRSFGIPLCAGLPVGHETPNWAVPFGVKSRLSVTDSVRLDILEEIF